MDSRVLGSYTGLAPYKCLVLMGYLRRLLMDVTVYTVRWKSGF
ncbi:hypothetical protein FOIG_16914 [Fusarium odoratissimum NRRL 54006]|uniref:Uncharacterized protein n=1 Tax=Fusarium odoratissimum (strain NRRL 54006) TaxID=1089451 RepID=X0ILV0_FUSO5|nr:uncharacterized protein FOIG_16914 [Fusarium odoratissimum NRRL 54006]EXL89802.1 hypothetical protein FOIG_16914 [Fusarium odoratissimum NRRL 54006]